MNQSAESPTPIASFKDYRQIVFALANDLRRLREHARECASEWQQDATVQHITDAMQRLENHTFSIAVVGEFKRGKSTFINALLGKEILPADIVPTSATLNRVTFGLKPTVQIFFKDAPDHVEEIPIEQLADYVTKLTPEAEEIAATVREAVVHYPVPYCKNNVDIIDTPGLGDDEAMTAVTLGALPQVDAAVFVVMANATFSETEGAFLERLLAQGIGRVLFVVTGIDRLERREDQERVIQKIGERIAASIARYAAATYGADTEAAREYLAHYGKPRVSGLSGYQAVIAKRTNNAALLLESRFEEFERLLERFLTEEGNLLALRARALQVKAIAGELLKAATERNASIGGQRRRFEAQTTVLKTMLDTLLRMGQEEVIQTEAAVERARERVRPVTAKIGGDLKRAAAQAVAALPINANELESNASALQQRLSEAVIAKVEAALRAGQPEIAAPIQEELAAERARLWPFATTFDRMMQYADAQLRDCGLTLPPSAALLTLLGGPTGFAPTPPPSPTAPSDGSELTARLNLPPAWLEPVYALPAVRDCYTVPANESWLKRTARQMFLVDTYRAAMTKAAGDLLEQALLPNVLGPQIHVYVGEQFEALKNDLHAFLEHAQERLNELRRHGERLDILAEREQQALAKTRAELGDIERRATALAGQLLRTDAEPRIPTGIGN